MLKKLFFCYWSALFCFGLASPLLAESKLWSVYPAPLPGSRLESVRLANDQRCRSGELLVEEFFSVADYDPTELLLVKESETGQITRQPVQWIDAKGRIVVTHCASATLDTIVKAWFLRHDGHATSPIGYRLQLQGHAVEGAATELQPLHRHTRYAQFASKEHPEQGTCCWHYVYLVYPKPVEEPITSLTIPLEIKEAPQAGNYMYWQFHAAINNINFYMGLQTDLLNKGQSQGPGVLFSRWDSQDAVDFQVAPGGFSEVGSHEGRFVGVRKPHPWGVGRWSLNLTRRNAEDPEHVWLDMTLKHDTEPVGVAVGSLRFPGQSARFTKDMTVVVESYGFATNHRANIWQIPDIDFSVHTPQMNGKPFAKPPRIIYPEKAPHIIDAEILDGRIRLHRSLFVP
ncbi:MAG: hypothetical protein HQL77_05795 [Magnetococcales bacterium]|nr:hypothetical protein [Magnetococcales bacterium]